jgi:hypothetical protein
MPNVDASFLIRGAHGGRCCGISHIHTFPRYPDDIINARPRKTAAEIKETWAVLPQTSLFANDELPEQTAEARFKRLVYLAQNGDGVLSFGRPQGILEVVLTSKQAETWREVVEAEGFKEVTAARNSNSGNVIHVFHLRTGANQPEEKIA